MTAAACTSSAAGVAADYELNGVDDWFLPNKDEIEFLYAQKDVVDGFVSDNYWSSSEVVNIAAWDQSFNDGSQGTSGKEFALGVRAVRALLRVTGLSTHKLANTHR